MYAPLFLQPKRTGDDSRVVPASLRDTVDELIRAGPVAAALNLPLDMRSIRIAQHPANIGVVAKIQCGPHDVLEQSDLAHPGVIR